MSKADNNEPDKEDDWKINVKNYYTNYVGMEDGYLIYKKPKLSHLVGKLSKKGADEMRDQIKKLRAEWDKNL